MEAGDRDRFPRRTARNAAQVDARTVTCLFPCSRSPWCSWQSSSSSATWPRLSVRPTISRVNTKTAISIAGAISQVCADNRKLTWLEAMGQLRELGFIETKTAPGQEFAYAPIVNPMIAVKRLQGQTGDLWRLFQQKWTEGGAAIPVENGPTDDGNRGDNVLDKLVEDGAAEILPNRNGERNGERRRPERRSARSPDRGGGAASSWTCVVRCVSQHRRSVS